jgi:hypothetical protein
MGGVGSVSFEQFGLIIGALVLVFILIAVIIGRRTQAQDALRHESNLGVFEPGVVGNLQERVRQASAGNPRAMAWLHAFVQDTVEDAAALRIARPKAEAAARIASGDILIPSEVQSFLDKDTEGRRWKSRRRRGIRPRVSTKFSLVRIVLPWHVSRRERSLQDIEQVLLAIESFSKGDSE